MAQLPREGWVAFVATPEHGADVPLYSEVPKACIARDVLYICTGGPHADTMELDFDIAIVDRWLSRKETGQVPNGDEDTYSPVTIADSDYAEGFWLALNLAWPAEHDTSFLVCLDCTQNGIRDELVRWLDAINHGWMPDEAASP